MLISHIFLFIVGFLLLIKGANFFIEASSRLAKKFGVSEFIIGLTLTAIGTSIPELASSISASLKNYSGLIIGNVVGSNIANIGLVIGISAFLLPIKTKEKMFARDGFILIFSTILFLLFSLDNQITRVEAIALIVVYLFYILFLIKTDNKNENKYTFHDFLHYVFDFQYIASIKSRFLKSALDKNPNKRTHDENNIINSFRIGVVKDISIVVLSGIAIIFGAKYLVTESIWLANLLSIPQNLIGLSIVAIGTSLPELTVSIAAAKKGQSNFVMGNVVGSNIANILLVVGVSGIISPIQVTETSVIFTLPILLFFSLFLLFSIKSNWKIEKRKGLMLIGLYILFLTLAFINGWN